MGEEEEEGHRHPGPAGDVVLAGVGAGELGGGLEVVVVEGQQSKVSKTADKPDEGEEVGSHPQRAELDDLQIIVMK